MTILTDSRLATLLIEHNAKATANTNLVKAVRAIYWKTKHTGNITIRWIPAHIGTIGNETADSLAEEGTRRAALPRQGLTNPDLVARIHAQSFITNPTTTPRKRTLQTDNQPTHTHPHKKAKTTRQLRLNFERRTRPAT